MYSVLIAHQLLLIVFADSVTVVAGVVVVPVHHPGGGVGQARELPPGGPGLGLTAPTPYPPPPTHTHLQDHPGAFGVGREDPRELAPGEPRVPPSRPRATPTAPGRSAATLNCRLSGAAPVDDPLPS